MKTSSPDESPEKKLLACTVLPLPNVPTNMAAASPSASRRLLIRFFMLFSFPLFGAFPVFYGNMKEAVSGDAGKRGKK